LAHQFVVIDSIEEFVAASERATGVVVGSAVIARARYMPASAAARRRGAALTKLISPIERLGAQSA
jgi:tryptophan synthase alpha subunit